MSEYISPKTIKSFREDAGLTQRQLADKLGVTDKAVSKWETGRGLPDISLLGPLAKALGVTTAELLTGKCVKNSNRAANLSKSLFYVCPICGNFLFAAGEATVSCCGVQLEPLESDDSTGEHMLELSINDGEVYISSEHSMEKDHYVSFIAYVTTNRVILQKFYPEQDARTIFPYLGEGIICLYCNKHGLASQRVVQPATKRRHPIG